VNKPFRQFAGATEELRAALARGESLNVDQLRALGTGERWNEIVDHAAWTNEPNQTLAQRLLAILDGRGDD
jgi:hypothetical protein